MLLKVKRVKTEDSYMAPVDYIKTYLKWMEYLPKHWNVAELLNKKASELSNEEIEILKLIKEENEHKDIFKKHIQEDRQMVSISNEIHSYATKMSIDKYASMKLTQEEIKYCKKIVSSFSRLDEIDLALSKLKENENRDMKEEYILFLLNEKQYRVGIQDLNSQIRKDIEENRKQDLHGYEKSINTRIK